MPEDIQTILDEVKKIGPNVDGLKTKADEAVKEAKKALEEAGTVKTAYDAIKSAMDANDTVIKQLTEDLKKTIEVCDRLQVEGKQKQEEQYKPLSFMISEAVEKQRDKLKPLIEKNLPTGKFPLELDKKAVDYMRNVWKFRESKAVGDMTVAASVVGAIPITYRAEIVSLPFELVHVRNLVPVVASDTDTYHFYRAKIGEGAVAFQTDENAPKAQLDDDLEEVQVTLNFLAGWERISRKMLKNFSGLRDWLSRWLPERYYKAEDAAAVAALTAAIPAGNKATITAADSIIDAIIAGIAQQRSAGYNVNAIVTTGAIWGKLIGNADTSGLYTLPNVMIVSPTGQIMFAGIPVYTASWVPADTVLIGDWNYFNIVQSEALNVLWSDEDRDNFIVNKVTVKVEACIGFAVLQPAAFYQITASAA